MDSKQLRQLSTLSEADLTERLIALAQRILLCHDNGMGLLAFEWHDLIVDPEGSLILENVAETKLTDDVRQRNFHDYAGVVYCVVTGQTSAESMAWDAGRKIKQPVLREIVLTFCGRNSSIEPLIAKLREPYTDDDTFFDGYTTVDEKEASEAYEKGLKIARENAFDNAAVKAAVSPTRKPWLERIGVFLIIALCVGGYRACKASERAKQEAAERAIRQQNEMMRQQREQIREFSKEITPGLRKGIQQGSSTVSENNDTVLTEE